MRQLLNHTSGLPQDVSGSLPPRGAQLPLLARPGSAHSYSNLNYAVLGLIVENVTGHRLERVVRDRIFRPLRLADTSYGTAAMPAHSDRRPAWLGAPEAADSPISGAAGIVSTSDDLARFFRALLGGELLPPGLLSEMTRTVYANPDARAGLGLFRIDLPCGSAWGHGGDESAYSDQVLVARDASKIVVVAQNALGWQSVEAKAEELYCR